MWGQVIGAGLSVAGSLLGNKRPSGPSLPRWLQNDLRQNSAMANQIASRPASEMIAGFSNDQINAMQRARERVDWLDPDLAAAQGRSTALAGGVGASDIAQFYNPFESDVVGSLMRDADRAATMNRMNASGAASQAGAFGGSRHGVYNAVMDAETQDNLQRNVGNLRMQGWTNAVNSAFQNQSARMAGNAQVADIIRQRREGAMNDTNMLNAVGQTVQGQNQRVMDWQKDALALRQNAAGQAAQAYSAQMQAQGAAQAGWTPRDPIAAAVEAAQAGWKWGGQLQSAASPWLQSARTAYQNWRWPSPGALPQTPIGNPTVPMPASPPPMFPFSP